MHRSTLSHRRLRALAGATVAAAALAVPSLAQAANAYRQVNLVSDQSGLAMLTDPNLVNPWGLAAGPTTPLWVANNGTGTASIYPGDVAGTPLGIAPLVVSIPMGAPTGQVFNPTMGFQVPVGGMSLPARFIFDSEQGTISAWPFAAPPPTSATTMATVPQAVFKGLTLARAAGRGAMLYAADFHHSRVVVFNRSFQRVNLPGGFRDRSLPDGFAPFGIQAIGNLVYVSYARQDAARQDEVDGPGLGFVDVYSPNGFLMKRLVQQGGLDAPWGLVRAPAGFGPFSGALLVGNFGNGRINAYDIHTGRWMGTLRRPGGDPIEIDGLWGLRFGNGVTGSRHTLLFSAGIDAEAHGLLGSIRHAG
jgi:uncharacterized protein (TIGR03118 family)